MDAVEGATPGKMREAWFEFKMHAATYVLVNAFLVSVDLFLDGGGLEWAFWPIGGWGIGLAMHGVGLKLEQRRLGSKAT